MNFVTLFRNRTRFTLSASTRQSLILYRYVTDEYIVGKKFFVSQLVINVYRKTVNKKNIKMCDK